MESVLGWEARFSSRLLSHPSRPREGGTDHHHGSLKGWSACRILSLSGRHFLISPQTHVQAIPHHIYSGH